jgi:hypothetical protein
MIMQKYIKNWIKIKPVFDVFAKMNKNKDEN